MKALILFSLLFSTLVATVRPLPCHWGVQAEYLCFKSRSEQSDFTAQFEGGSANLINNQGDFKSGVRIEGIYGIDTLHDLHARFTYFHPGKSVRRVSGTLINPFLPDDAVFSGSATSRLGFQYFAFEALYGRWLYDCANFDFALQAGLLYTNIKYDERLNFAPNTVTTATHAATFIHHCRFWGLGPEIAIDFQYPFQNCGCGIFSIAANARGAILASVTKAKLTSIVTPAQVTTSRFFGEDIWRATPVFDARIGLNWEYACFCYSPQIEVGYEWIWAHFAANKITPIALTINQYSDVNFQGPYIAVAVGF